MVAGPVCPAVNIQRSELLDALAAAMRLAEPVSHSFPNQHLLSRREFRDEFEVHRAGPKLTLWRISRDRPNTLRLFHALLGNDKVKSAVIDAILSLVGVTAALARRPNAIEIVCQPGLFSAWTLLDVIESALAHALPLSKRPKAGPALKPALIRANLALAPIADYIFPPLGLANAALVLLSRQRKLRVARFTQALRSRGVVFIFGSVTTSREPIGCWSFIHPLSPDRRLTRRQRGLRSCS
jgi:hypothetical protein